MRQYAASTCKHTSADNTPGPIALLCAGPAPALAVGGADHLWSVLHQPARASGTLGVIGEGLLADPALCADIKHGTGPATHVCCAASNCVARQRSSRCHVYLVCAAEPVFSCHVPPFKGPPDSQPFGIQ